MPIVNNEINHLNALVGPPPRQLAALAIFGFIALTVVFFYLFFVVNFQYTYKGTISVGCATPHKLLLTLPNSSEIDINRINNGKLSIKVNQVKNPITYNQAAQGKNYIGNNQFIFNNNTTMVTANAIPCEVCLTTLTLYQRFVHKYYKL